jgi:hypothetical protein
VELLVGSDAFRDERRLPRVHDGKGITHEMMVYRSSL